MLARGLELMPDCTEADVRVFLADALLKNGQIRLHVLNAARDSDRGMLPFLWRTKEKQKEVGEHCGKV